MRQSQRCRLWESGKWQSRCGQTFIPPPRTRGWNHLEHCAVLPSLTSAIYLTSRCHGPHRRLLIGSRGCYQCACVTGLKEVSSQAVTVSFNQLLASSYMSTLFIYFISVVQWVSEFHCSSLREYPATGLCLS